jgi:hypothetical protein
MLGVGAAMRPLILCTIGSLLACTAAAATYPVSGRWTYRDATAPGPAQCNGGPQMDFLGTYRRDSGGGVPELRNVSVTQTGKGVYRVVDEFFNVLARGRVYYTLQLVDDDHLMMRLDRGGKTIELRRCATS